MQCPKCKNENVIKSGINYYASGTKQRWFCKDCMTYFVT